MSDPPIIAERTLEAEEPTGEVRELRVQVLAPMQLGEDEYECRFYVHGLPGGQRFARGVDSLQALVAAIKSANRLIADTAEDYGWRVRWLGKEMLSDLLNPRLEEL